MAEGIGVDGLELFFYRTSDGSLSAVASVSDLERVRCLGGTPGFSVPLDCFGDYGLDLLRAFDGAGAAPGCEQFVDAGQE
jgi:hypothetical protein